MIVKKISIGCDHGGVDAKNALIDYLKKKGIEIVDRGTYTKDSCDYPIFAEKVARDVQANIVTFGILICNSGEGMEMAANKVKGVRAALLYNDQVAALAKQHNNANVITFGAKFFTPDQIIKMTQIFMDSDFLGDRHARRVGEIDSIKE